MLSRVFPRPCYIAAHSIRRIAGLPGNPVLNIEVSAGEIKEASNERVQFDNK
jgi:hypothetical protein